VKYNYKRREVMKVIFLEDVPNVARAGEIKEVANGHGRNFLIPKGLAVLASSSAANTVEIQRRIRAKEEAILAAEVLGLANQLEGKEVVLKAKVGAKDRLYGSVTSADIASELEKATGLVVDKRKIELAEPIRQLGSYEVAIRLAKDVVPKIKVNVIEQETEKEVKKTEKEAKKTEKEAKKTEKEAKKTEKEAKKTEKEAKETEEETG
jgi:large subunit ribosomal protein L9